MFFEDFVLQTEIPLSPVRIEKEKMLAFAREYDNIPLHTDEEYAKTTVFGGLIAPGVMSFMAVWAKVLEKNLFGNELVAGKSTRIEWHKPVYPEDVLTGKVVISALSPRGTKNGLVELTVYVYNQDNTLVLTNVTESVVKKRPIA